MSGRLGAVVSVWVGLAACSASAPVVSIPEVDVAEAEEAPQAPARRRFASAEAQVVMGFEGALCVRRGGEVACAGPKGSVLSGVSGETSSERLVRVPLPAKAVDLGLGVLTACAALEDGRLACWGFFNAVQRERLRREAAVEVMEQAREVERVSVVGHLASAGAHGSMYSVVLAAWVDRSGGVWAQRLDSAGTPLRLEWGGPVREWHPGGATPRARGCALMASGELRCAVTSHNDGVTFEALSGAEGVFVGLGSSRCGVREDGAAVCWGRGPRAVRVPSAGGVAEVNRGESWGRGPHQRRVCLRLRGEKKGVVCRAWDGGEGFGEAERVVWLEGAVAFGMHARLGDAGEARVCGLMPGGEVRCGGAQAEAPEWVASMPGEATEER